MINNLFFDVTPPRPSNGVTLTVDGTVRAYDLGSLGWGEETTWTPNDAAKRIFLTLQNDSSSDIYFVFNSDAGTTMDPTSAGSAGVAASLDSKFCMNLQAGGTVRVCVDRVIDRYLVVKASTGSTNLLRVSASSPPQSY